MEVHEYPGWMQKHWTIEIGMPVVVRQNMHRLAQLPINYETDAARDAEKTLLAV